MLNATDQSQLDEIERRLTSRGGPFELQWTKIDGIQVATFARGPKTLEQLFQRIRRRGEHSFIVDGSQRVSYGHVCAYADAVASSMQERFRCHRYARIGIASEVPVSWAAAFIAVVILGATPVLLDSKAAISDLLDAIERTNCTFFLCDRRVSETVGADQIGLPTIVVDDISLEIEKAGSSGVASASSTEFQPDDEALITFTSGTTSRPKAVRANHRSVMTGVNNMMLGAALANSRARRGVPMEIVRQSRPPCSLVLSPLSHIAGYAPFLLSVMVGGSLVFVDNANPDTILDTACREKVNSISGVTPEILHGLLKMDGDLRGLEALTSIGMHTVLPSNHLRNELADVLPGVSLALGYGMTETNGSVAVACNADLTLHPTTSGRLLPTVQARIVDEEGAELPPGKRGRLLLRGAMVAQGYCDAPSPLTDGWLNTGDMAYASDGFLYVIRRHDEETLIHNLGGYALDVEDIALSHPDVRDAALFVVPGEFGEPRIVLALAGHKQGIDNPEMILKYLRDRLGIQLGGLGIFLIEAIPRTRSGKPVRAELVRCFTEETTPHPSGVGRID